MALVVGDDDAYGIHGLRVAGYNACKATSGDEVASVHGGWHGDSASRYGRFSLRLIFGIAARMCEEPSGYDRRPPNPRALRVPAPPTAEPAEEPPAEEAEGAAVVPELEPEPEPLAVSPPHPPSPPVRNLRSRGAVSSTSTRRLSIM